MKKIVDKIAFALKFVFGYGMMICLLVGGLTFFGYLAAICIGGDVAKKICEIIYEHIYPVLVILSTSMIVLGLIRMYIVGESSFSGAGKKTKFSLKKNQ